PGPARAGPGPGRGVQPAARVRTMAPSRTGDRPMTDTSTLIALGRDHYLPVYRQRELVLERGRGARVWDREGREYIDLSAGIAVCGLGHNDPDLVAALVEQAGRLWHTSN